MRLLFVTPQVPWPPRQGTALRNFHLLDAAAAAHDVDLLSFEEADGGPGGAAPAPILERCGRVETVAAPARSAARRLRDLAGGWADMERRLWSPAFRDRLAAMLRAGAYDAVQLEGFEVAGYLLGPRALRDEAFERAPWATAGRPAPALIFDDHNAEHRLQASAARIDAAIPRRWPRAAYSAVQARRLRAREALYCAAADACIAVSTEDAHALEALVPGLGVDVVPNGVDCASMPPPAPAATPTIFFSGKLDYRPNVDACEWLVREILPPVRARVPDVRLVLAGRDPAPAVRQLAGDGVEVTGALSEAALAQRRAGAWVYVVPMRMGSGVRFKVLEAMAAGIPLVTTPLGAAGSGAVHGEHALIAEEAAGLAGAVADLLQQAATRDRLAAAARSLAQVRHDWRHVAPRLLDLYERLRAPAPARVSVVTTVLNERDSIAQLLDSLAAQTRPPDETVVVDGGSTDGTAAMLETRAGGQTSLRVERAPGANISQGRNRAIAAAAHDVLAVTDAGVALHPSWLERLTAALWRGRAVAAASGFFVAAPQTTWELALGATTLPAAEEIDPARFLPSSRSVAFRRAAWEGAGRYPEWLDYGEDLVFDLALLERAGPPRFVPRAVVRFRPRPGVMPFFLQYYRYARGDGKADLWRKRHAIRYGSYLAGGALLRQCLSGAHPRAAALALLLGGAAYLRRPLRRLAQQSPSAAKFCRAATLVPLVRVTGDVAKMAGYPAGVLWRLRRRGPASPLSKKGAGEQEARRVGVNGAPLLPYVGEGAGG